MARAMGTQLLREGQLTRREVGTFIRLCGKLEHTQPWTLELFEALARCVVCAAYEVVCFQYRPEGWCVFLARRATNDIYWPNEWHSPGTILRATDKTLTDALKRLMERELAPATISKPIFTQLELNRIRRGTELRLIHIAYVIGMPNHGQFFPVDKPLPEPLMDHHRSLIEIALTGLPRLNRFAGR
ncbi:hypothetical protein HYZ80_02480 [Candidatus Parcubacteria bacterium]|nr:hypothetical protein [Candidatus Parcubacteria bacterium]